MLTDSVFLLLGLFGCRLLLRLGFGMIVIVVMIVRVVMIMVVIAMVVIVAGMIFFVVLNHGLQGLAAH